MKGLCYNGNIMRKNNTKSTLATTTIIAGVVILSLSLSLSLSLGL